MITKKYSWGGWKMPIFHLNDPDYCEFGCPICTKARTGNSFAKFIQRIELAITFGGCPWGRAREKKYGVKPNEQIQQEKC
ncbi:MAG: hypothetical protein JJV89_03395 [Desulfosarcina sp.]|nr:hypothetical protein [Desulfobacterales bacterium]